MLQRRTALLAALLLAMVAAADARIPRNEAERLKDEERLRRQQQIPLNQGDRARRGAQRDVHAQKLPHA